MTLSESEITEYGVPYGIDEERYTGSNYRIGFFVNCERLPNISECVIGHAGPCPLTRQRQWTGHICIASLRPTLC